MKKRRQEWTIKEIQLLESIHEGNTIKEIQVLIKRTKQDILGKMASLGLAEAHLKYPSNLWKPHEDAEVLTGIFNEENLQHVAHTLSKSVSIIQNRIVYLKLIGRDSVIPRKATAMIIDYVKSECPNIEVIGGEIYTYSSELIVRSKICGYSWSSPVSQLIPEVDCPICHPESAGQDCEYLYEDLLREYDFICSGIHC